jgi:nitrogen-specific signal transduction histidine kinase
MKTDYDESIGLVNIIPQDIGRVILNLITNAFYAVTERSKQLAAGSLPESSREAGPQPAMKSSEARTSLSTSGSDITSESLTQDAANSERQMANGDLTANSQQLEASSRYEPTVTLSTKKLNDKIEIRVSDNGNGIPQQILAKIFQPFFTTKPTGQGTGLGLSLSYDIVKAHGGDIKVETKEGEFTKFIIQIPV